MVQNSDEFQIACALRRLNQSLEFTTDKSGGADFRIDGTNVRIEAKSKLNRTFIDNFYLPDGVDERVCKRLISRDAIKSGMLEKAFEDQHTDIAVVNLRHSEFGIVFAAYAYETDMANYTVERSFTEAMSMLRKGKKAVILVTEAISATGSYNLIAFACDKETIELKGGELEKTEKGKHLDSLNAKDRFFKIIEEAKVLEHQSDRRNV